MKPNRYSRAHWLGIAALVSALTANPAASQSVPPGPTSWTLLTRLRATGSSRKSEPAGYRVYSAIGLGIALRRVINRHLAVEIAGAFDSREVDQTLGTGPATNLGSLESIPLSGFVQYDFRPEGKVRPYLGAGGNLTVFWEKSGQLDSDGVAPSVGPAVQAGFDVALSGTVTLNVDYTWNLSATKVKTAAGVDLVTLKIHPSAFGIGVGFRF